MTSADLVVQGCRRLVTCRGPIPKRENALQDAGPVDKAWIASSRGRIVFIGKERDFRAKVRPERSAVHLDGTGMVGLPGFVDSHTHLPFAGNRVEEFRLRLRGYTYQQLAKKGMGIQTTVAATRRASKKDLLSLCLARLDRMMLHGATTVEAKSGYGLNLKDEIKQLEVLKEAARHHPVDIVSTFMGAHDIPKEYKTRKSAYIDLLIKKIMPEVRRRDLAEFFDVFCEKGVFSVEETRRLAEAAKRAGFKIRIHADEFSALGGAELAAEVGAASADHLISITEKGIRVLSRSETAATLLPSVSFFLMLEKKAPARRLIDAGAALNLASDFNPGSSMIGSMLFVMQLGVYLLKMSIEEALNAVTANAAFALRRHDSIGSLEVGKKMDMLLCDVPEYASLVYELGWNPIRHVIKNGRVVVRDGKRNSSF
ncbi:MAG TPA: imidazolonepropionase [Candidatus Desulfaltia sp.]|nr:imidazolonepropionase [Candidatus Desulfaltia sp.]